MEKEYNFLIGECGKFYFPNLKLNLPIYFNGEFLAFVDKITISKKIVFSL